MSFVTTLLGLLGLTGTAQAACSNLVIDGFSRSGSSGFNNLEQWTSDDGTMGKIALANGVLSFTPKPDSTSYYYENIGCIKAASQGYKALSLTVKGPRQGSSMLVEIQTKSHCSQSTIKRQWVQIENLTGATQNVTIPFTAFNQVNLDGISAFIWSTYSDFAGYEFSNVQLSCNEGPSSPDPTSRLTFLFYNAMIQPSSDDGTMANMTVENNRVTLNPTDTSSYFYSKTACTNVQNKYGGISMRVKAPKGAVFGIQMASSTTCGGEDTGFGYQTTAQLGWTFDGTEKLYSFSFDKYPTIDKTKVSSILFTALTKSVTLGPMSFYCGNTASEYVVKGRSTASSAVPTISAPAGNAPSMVIDTFASRETNNLRHWHGGDNEAALDWSVKNQLTIRPPDADFAFYTQFENGCADLTSYDGSYLHIAFKGSNQFTVALQQHNQKCDDSIAPYPETWDSLEAARYTTGNSIYIPMSHFNIQRGRVIGLALKGFYTRASVTFSRIEIVPSVPSNVRIPSKLPSGNLIFACKRPNSIAFAIDDGDPKFAQEVMEIIRSENIKVTFFTVGAPLRDPSTNLSTIYQDMMTQGHQMALHSYTHPKMEGLPNNDAIAWEYNQDIDAVADMFGGLRTKYFRPPFGNEGSRMRQQLVETTGRNDAYIVNWNIDVEDWLWALSDTPEKQLEAFDRDLKKGGSLVVMHYLYPSTVKYLRQFIQMAKATGKQLMRVDQCMEDPEAPPL
ncbi:Chitin deacetylase-like protein 3 [Colletotrichum chlorophyti]|uniref:Chitin deacetylase-like protein 3 n=1 Tax=Colletotrichum chlorophyti TaxID=708187 RepID=A0A1Q8S2H8_9PEZI|nr:Chitin deacetylase-like protein 3 [Colletotrichum chlorophyti]